MYFRNVPEFLQSEQAEALGHGMHRLAKEEEVGAAGTSWRF